MRTISITTTQNVTIEYELAELRDRIIAWVIDFILICFSIMAVGIFLAMVFSPDSEEGLSLTFLVPFVIIFFFYTLVSEIILEGQTLGKKMAGIRIVKTSGIEPRIGDYFIRWAFRLVDIYFSAGSIAAILISSSDHSQRLGDLISNTALIKVRPSRNFLLSDILNINSADNYKIKYPEVRSFTEKEMLLIKNVVERARKYPNQAHRHALEQVSLKAAKELGLPNTPADHIKFLKTIIMDYIVMTR